MAEEEEYEGEEEDDEQNPKNEDNKIVENKVEENKININPINPVNSNFDKKSEEKKETQSKKTKSSKKSTTKSKKTVKVDENAYILQSPEKVISTRAFLESTVTNAIQEALLELSRKREQIDDPLTFVGEYLIKKAKEKNK